MTFPVQGVFYQASLYLIPLMLLLRADTRSLLKHALSCYWPLLLLIVLPTFLSLIINGYLGLGGRFSGISDIPMDPFFRLLWRIALFSLCLYVLYQVLELDLMFIAKLIFIGAVIYGISSICKSYEPIAKFLVDGKNIRLFGTVGSPNELGILMSIGIFSGVGLLIFSSKKQQNVWQIIITGLVIILLFCLLITQSRGAWLAFFVALISFLFVLVRSGQVRKVIYIGLTIGFVSAILALLIDMDALQNRLFKLFIDDIRLAIWQYFLGVWKENWLFGVYDLGSYNYMHTNNHVYKNPHSVFLDVLVRTGLLGFMSFLVFLATIFCQFWRFRTGSFVIGLFFSIVVGTTFSFSIYGKEFAQSLYTLLFFLYLIVVHEKSVPEKVDVFQSTPAEAIAD